MEGFVCLVLGSKQFIDFSKMLWRHKKTICLQGYKVYICDGVMEQQYKHAIELIKGDLWG